MVGFVTPTSFTRDGTKSLNNRVHLMSCTRVCMSICMYIYVHVWMCICVCVYMCLCIYVCVRVCVGTPKKFENFLFFLTVIYPGF